GVPAALAGDRRKFRHERRRAHDRNLCGIRDGELVRAEYAGREYLRASGVRRSADGPARLCDWLHCILLAAGTKTGNFTRLTRRSLEAPFTCAAVLLAVRYRPAASLRPMATHFYQMEFCLQRFARARASRDTAHQRMFPQPRVSSTR